MTNSQIKAKLIELGVPAGFIDCNDDGVHVDYETLEWKHTSKLEAFVKSCNVQASDKGLFLTA